MADGADGITHSSGQNQMNNEGEEEEWNRGVNMGHGLQRLTRARRSRLPIVIAEGKIRHVVPVIAAKWTTECNIIVRNHIPVLTHWSKYKRRRDLTKMFQDKLNAKFDMDTTDPITKKACMGMMNNAVRQQRYRLKKEFFNPFPLHLVPKTSPIKCMSDQQWLDLVESWKTPEQMEICQINKENRGNVQLHQTTGSQSYTVFVENIGDKYNDHEPDAFDLFKDCHYSKKKKGFTPAVQDTIAQMENRLSTTIEGEAAPKSADQVVADVLSEKTRKNRFLHNVGIKIAQPTSSEQNGGVPDLQAENVELRSIVNAQHGQIDDLTKKHAELEARLELYLSQVRPNSAA